MALIGKSLEKHMRRNPIPDEDIKGSLEWAQQMISSILTGENIPVVSEPYDGQVIDTKSGEIVDAVSPLVPFEPADETTLETASVNAGANV